MNINPIPAPEQQKLAEANGLALKQRPSANKQQLRETAEDFEAVVTGYFLNLIFKGLESEHFFGAGHAEEVYRSLLVDEYGKSIAKSGGLGVADMVYQQLLQQQLPAEAASPLIGNRGKLPPYFERNLLADRLSAPELSQEF